MLHDTTHRLGHILGVTSLLILLEFSRAFSPRTNQPSTSTAPIKTFDADDALNILTEAKTEGMDVVDINLDKAREFAGHYGKYSYDEVEHMRNDLHAHRILNDSPSDILFLERIIEDELSSQLKSLEEQLPEPYLFRYPDYDGDIPHTGLFGSSMEQEWHSFDPPSIDSTTTVADTEPEKKTFSPMADAKKLVGEGVIESVVICVVLALLMMAPDQVA